MKRSSTNIAATIITITLLTALTGCNGPARFPFGGSYDKHEFLSTPSQPLTVILIDTFSGETIWSLDIPVGQKAVVDLGTGADMLLGNKPQYAQEIRWGLFKPDQSTYYNFMPETKKLSGNPVMLKLIVRDPESYPAVLATADNTTPPIYIPIQSSPQSDAPAPAPAPAPESASAPAPAPTPGSASETAPEPEPAPVKRNFNSLRATDK